jgi:hypothetical protein
MATKRTNLQPSIIATRNKGATKVQEKKTKDGLRKPQVRVLTALSKSKQPLTRSEISTKAEVDLASLTEVIGSSDAAKRKHNDKKMGWKSLLTLKYVTAKDGEEGATTYVITAAGRKVLTAATKGGK